MNSNTDNVGNTGNEVNGNVSESNESGNRGLDPKGNPRKPEDLEKQIARRNKRLAAFFELIELPVKIIGDENAPAIIYKGKVLNAYVQNFYLHFTDAPKEGNTVYTVKLLDKPEYDRNKIMECINTYPMRNIHHVLLKHTENELYLAGYNFLNKEKSEGRYPVFASFDGKIYFTEEKAQEVADELGIDGYECSVVIPDK